MELILTHSNVDFDALAAQVAASRLHPDALMVRGPSVGQPIRDFLAVHKDRFPLVAHDELDYARVDRVILVDVRRASRLRDYAPVLERILARDPSLDVHIYDHHPDSPDDVHGRIELVVPLGAVSTLMCEVLQRRRIPLDAMEATLLALGIYADTGSLTFPSTTPRDLGAAAWLLSRGASLKTLRHYLHTPMNPGQQGALKALLGASEVFELQGTRVAIASIAVDGSVNGLAEVTSEALEIEGHDALFALFHQDGVTWVVGRAQVPQIEVGEILMRLGGGGHTGAGSARVRELSAGTIRDRILGALRDAPPTPRLVRFVMSSPVVTIDVGATLLEARELMARHDVSGLPVTRSGGLAGVISRRDLHDAERDEHLEMPVASRMAHRLHAIETTASIRQAMALMTREDVGRLPVMEAGHLVGIVTRSDLLALLYPPEAAGAHAA